jgi:class 3 adenylate cyclase
VGVEEPEVRYAEREGKFLAYEVFGSGPCDLLLQQNVFPIDLMWDLPKLAAFLERLGTIARVIAFDSPGYGASDPVIAPGAATVEQNADAITTVLDAARAPRVAILDISHAIGAVTFAATYPQRVRSLIAVHLRSSWPELRSLSVSGRRKLALQLSGIGSLEAENPRVAHDPVLRHWWARARRLLQNREQSLEMIEFAARIDVAPFLSAVHVPTLVLHCVDNAVYDIELSRTATNLIPDARFVELPGSENAIFLGDTNLALNEIERFLAEPATLIEHDRVLATVLFTDIVGSTEQLAAHGDSAWRHKLDDHDNAATQLVRSYRGAVVKQTGDGILATFDGAARAVLCASELLATAERQGITLRAGLHTGEIELRPSDVTGIAVVIAQRISALATANEILVSRTVVDLTAGSGLKFEPHGEHHLKGVPRTWPIFSARA